LILTNAGYFGAVPPETREGDLCVCVAPLLEPLILRPLTPDQTPKFDPEDEICRWANDCFLTLKSDEESERLPTCPTAYDIPIWPAAGDIEEVYPFLLPSGDVTYIHTIEEGAAILSALPGSLGMSHGMGPLPPGKVKRRKSPVKETDILHCKVVGKCRIYGFPLWNTDGDPTSRYAATAIGNVHSKVFVMH
jgi:hypothetical protein